MKEKKIVVTGLAAAMSLVMLAGCGHLFFWNNNL